MGLRINQPALAFSALTFWNTAAVSVEHIRLKTTGYISVDGYTVQENLPPWIIPKNDHIAPLLQGFLELFSFAVSLKPDMSLNL